MAPKYFRHTFRTLHGVAGTDKTETRKMLGHESLAMGFRYMELDEAVLREDQGAYERLILSAYRYYKSQTIKPRRSPTRP